MNHWNLVTKYRIRQCNCWKYKDHYRCRKWFIDDLNGKTGIYGTYESWNAALDTVIRAQTRQYYQLTVTST